MFVFNGERVALWTAMFLSVIPCFIIFYLQNILQHSNEIGHSVEQTPAGFSSVNPNQRWQKADGNRVCAANCLFCRDRGQLPFVFSYTLYVGVETVPAACHWSSLLPLCVPSIQSAAYNHHPKMTKFLLLILRVRVRLYWELPRVSLKIF